MANELIFEQRRSVPIEEKIKIFEEFRETGEQLTRNTVFKGYPIGQWGATIRYYRKKKITYITEEQYKKLEKLGIWENLKLISVDKQIDMLIDWKQRYPEHDVKSKKMSKDILKRYTTSLEEQAKIQEEYKRIYRCYIYVSDRKNIGKLTEAQLLKIKNGNIGGLLGYSDDIMKLAEVFGQSPNDINYICKRYKNIEKFASLYWNGLLKDEDVELAKKTIKNVLDIDRNPNSDKYDKLVSEIYDLDQQQLCLYSSSDIDRLLQELSEKRRAVIIERFGLQTGKTKILEETGERLNIGKERVRQLENTAIAQLRVLCKENPIDLNSWKESEWLTEKEKTVIFQLEYMIYRSNIVFNLNENRKTAISGFDGILGKNIDMEEYERLSEEIKELKAKVEERKILEKSRNLEVLEDISINELGLSTKLCGNLNKAGYSNVRDIVTSKKKKIPGGFKIDNIGNIVAEKKADLQRQVVFMEMQAKEMEAYYALVEDPIEDCDEEFAEYLKHLPVEQLKISIEVYRYLKRLGYDTASKVFELKEEDVLKLKGIGKARARTILGEVEKSKENISDRTGEELTKYLKLEELKREKTDLEKEMAYTKSQLPEAKRLLSQYDKMLNGDRDF